MKAASEVDDQVMMALRLGSQVFLVRMREGRGTEDGGRRTEGR